jgi:hypothetical protein
MMIMVQFLKRKARNRSVGKTSHEPPQPKLPASFTRKRNDLVVIDLPPDSSKVTTKQVKKLTVG